MNAPRILLAEDDVEMRRILAWCLREEGYEVIECPDGARLLMHLDAYLLPRDSDDASERYDLVISDVRMPGVSGLTVLEGVQLCEEFPPMILITAFGDEEIHQEAERLGAIAFLDKPFEVDELVAKVREVVPR